jgi:hypothetical protein
MEGRMTEGQDRGGAFESDVTVAAETGGRGLTITENPPFFRTKGGAELSTGCDFSPLADAVGEDLAKAKVEEMLQALAPGIWGAGLYGSIGSCGGMSLARIRFGPDLPLYMHSHPGWGDCLYFVLSGEVRLWHRRLGPGSAVFVPAGQMYKYTIGPEGADVLEFRAGEYTTDLPAMKIEEQSLEAVQTIIDTANANHAKWEQFGQAN